MNYSTIFLLLLWTSIVYAQPTSNFSSNKTSACAPALIQFQDNSTVTNGHIVQWEWYKNDTLFSTIQNPGLYINNSGIFDICLKVTDSSGNIDSLHIEDFITIYKTPVVSFVSDQQTGCLPTTIVFTDTSIQGDTSIVNWRWDFGDGELDTIHQNPTHIYTTPGIFDVTLVVEDHNGCTDFVLQSDYMTIRDTPKVDITNIPTDPICQQMPVSINLGTNVHYGMGALSYTWDFGDNQIDTGTTVNHSYTISNSYLVSLTVSDLYCTATTTIPHNISVSEPPIVNFEIDKSISCGTPTHTASFLDKTLDAIAWNWELGDINWTSSDSATTQFYPNPGHYPINLKVTNRYGCENTAQDTVIVSFPDISFSYSKNKNCVPIDANFTGMYTNTNAIVGATSWHWFFGDGNDTTTSNNSVMHTYTDSGSYSIKLLVIDEVGCRDSFYRILNAGIPPQIFSTSIAADTICRSDVVGVSFIGSSYINNWTWSFTNEAGITEDFDRATGIKFPCLWNQTGMLMVSFNGCKTYIPTDSVYVLPPLASFKPNCGSLTIDFEDRSTGADHWSWNFGDPTTTSDTSNLQHPSYTYPVEGWYFVTLEVKNDVTGCIDIFGKNIWVGDVIADFDYPDTVCVGGPYPAYSTSRGSIGQIWSGANTHIWTPTNFGTIVRFLTPGIQELQLIIYHQQGCKDTIVKPIHVSKVYPDLTTTNNNSCIPYSSQIQTDSFISLYSPITQYTWSTGETTSNISHTQLTSNTTIYGVTVVNDLGCIAKDTISITGVEIIPDFQVETDICIYNNFSILDKSILDNKQYYYNWNFGDGVDSSGYPINYQYQQAGTYLITLSLTDSMGCTLTSSQWVTVHNPKANFSVDTTYSTCPPLQTNFTNLSSGATSWHWEFGDSSVSSLNAPSHVYSNTGQYDIMLVAKATPTCTDTLFVPNLIQIDGPSGNLTSIGMIGCAPLELTLNAHGNNIAKYIWLFGDGDYTINNTSNMVDTVSHQYLQQGYFVPQLILEDSLGCSTTLWGDTIVIEDVLIASFVADSTICEGDSITFIPQIIGANGSENIEWLFDMGNMQISSNQYSPAIHYPNAGVYGVSLRVDNNVCYETITDVSFLAVQAPPSASFIVNSPLCENSPIEFIGNSTTTKPIQNWHWDFGNGETSSSNIPPLVSFDTTGTYIVNLEISTEIGCVDSFSQFVTIQNNPTLSAGVDTTICMGGTVYLNGTSPDTLSFEWIGSYPISTPYTIQATSIPSASTSYTLIGENIHGCFASDTIIVTTISTVSTPFVDSIITCENNDITLSAKGSGVGDLVFLDNSGIELYRDTMSNNEPQVDFSIGTLTSGEYLFWVKEVNEGCESSLVKIVVLVQKQPDVVSVNGDFELCIGEQTILSSSNNKSLQWSSDPDLTNIIHVGNTYQIPNQLVLGTHKYWFLHEENGCPSPIDSFEIIVHNTPSPPIAAIDSICPNQHGSLNLPNQQYTTQWYSDALGTNYIGVGNQLTTPILSENATYYARYIDTNNCKSTLSPLDFLIHKVKKVEIQSITSLCKGDSTQLLLNNTSYQDYLWYSTFGNLSCFSCAQPTIHPEQNSTYHVVTEDSNSCVSSDTITVIVQIATKEDIPNRTICKGASLMLNPVNGSKPRWYGPNIICDTCDSPTITPTKNTTYSVKYTSIEGCLVKDSMQVEVLDLSSVIVDNQFVICKGDSLEIKPEISKEITPTWRTQTQILNTTDSSIMIAPSQSVGLVMSTGRDACLEDHYIKVLVENPLLESSNAITICGEDTVAINLNTNATFVEWQPHTGVLSPFSSKTLITLPQSQDFNVIGHYEACPIDSIRVEVNVKPKPTLKVEHYQKAIIDEWIYLDVETESSNLIFWEPEDKIQYSNTSRGLTQINENSVFIVNVENEFGCVNSDSIVVEVASPCSEKLVHVPNAFSPNDDGVNDIIHPRTSSELVHNIKEFSIYNRWGNRVFKSTDIEQGWDGFYRGKEAHIDVYAYYVIYSCPYDGSDVIIKGDITLIR